MIAFKSASDGTCKYLGALIVGVVPQGLNKVVHGRTRNNLIDNSEKSHSSNQTFFCSSRFLILYSSGLLGVRWIEFFSLVQRSSRRHFFHQSFSCNIEAGEGRGLKALCENMICPMYICRAH